MGNDGIYAVNASFFGVGPIYLAATYDTNIIEEFFQVVAKSDEEWYLILDASSLEEFEKKMYVEYQYRQFARELRESIIEIGDFLSKDCDDKETEKRIRDEIWRWTWVW